MGRDTATGDYLSTLPEPEYAFLSVEYRCSLHEAEPLSACLQVSLDFSIELILSKQSTKQSYDFLLLQCRGETCPHVP
jgi:hypothetical protein